MHRLTLFFVCLYKHKWEESKVTGDDKQLLTSINYVAMRSIILLFVGKKRLLRKCSLGLSPWLATSYQPAMHCACIMHGYISTYTVSDLAIASYSQPFMHCCLLLRSTCIMMHVDIAYHDWYVVKPIMIRCNSV